MIDRSEIEVATDLSLAPEIVEKDYVLGWLLERRHYSLRGSGHGVWYELR